VFGEAAELMAWQRMFFDAEVMEPTSRGAVFCPKLACGKKIKPGAEA
jgi:hypothetical protein